MNNWPIALGTGLVLICFGSMMIRAHRRAWQFDRYDEELDEDRRKHAYRKYRRRMQTSSIFILVGILVPFGNLFIPWNQKNALWLTIYWIGVLGLLLWVILMAIADMISIRMRGNSDLNEVKRKRMILEEQLKQYRKKSTNGKPYR